jgi:hypothetical protein
MKCSKYLEAELKRAENRYLGCVTMNFCDFGFGTNLGLLNDNDLSYIVNIAIFRFCRRCAGGGPARYWPTRMRCRKCCTQAGHPFPGTQLPLTQPDTPVRGPLLPVMKREGGTRTSPGGKAPGAAEHNAGSGVPSAGPFQVGRSLSRRFVPGGGLPRSPMLGVPGRMPSPHAELPAPGRGVRPAPGLHWPRQGQAAHDLRPPAPSTSLGSNRAPGPV